MQDENYNSYQEEQSRYYEDICKRCGACCGSGDGDPCADLAKDKDGRYFCKVYESRLGIAHYTVGGNKFHCIPIRDVIDNVGARPNCAYVK